MLTYAVPFGFRAGYLVYHILQPNVTGDSSTLCCGLGGVRPVEDLHFFGTFAGNPALVRVTESMVDACPCCLIRGSIMINVWLWIRAFRPEEEMIGVIF